MHTQVNENKKNTQSLGQDNKRLVKESLKCLLGAGLLISPQRSKHQIHPFFLKEAFNSKVFK